MVYHVSPQRKISLVSSLQSEDIDSVIKSKSSSSGSERYGGNVPHRILNHHQDVGRAAIVLNGLGSSYAQVGGTPLLPPQASGQLPYLQKRQKSKRQHTNAHVLPFASKVIAETVTSLQPRTKREIFQWV